MYSEDGEILISTALAVPHDSVALCHEVGAMCEAYAKNKRVTATVCVARNQTGAFVILSPCGVCQERLWQWGGDVQAAVPLDDDTTRWKAVLLKDLTPHYWRGQFMSDHG
jgi:cytidine deaminase